MAISPFNRGSLSHASSDLFVSMRRDLTELQRQLVTGQKAETYGGLGFERRTSLDARAKLSAIEGYTSAIDQANLRIKLMLQNLERIGKLGSDTKTDTTLAKFELLSDGRTFAQKNAEQRLKEALDLLNVNIAGRSLFAGRAVDTTPVETYDRIMNGNGTLDGLKTVIAERLAAETGSGAYKYGRLSIASGPASVTITQEGAALPFGFKVSTAPPTGTAMTAANNGGATPDTVISFGANPADGDMVSITLTDPDGAAHVIRLTARAAIAPSEAATSFKIGASVAETVSNLEKAITTAVQDNVDTVLKPRAVSLVTESFFKTPTDLQRIPAPPDTATGFAPAVPGSNIVSWYKGDNDSLVNARNTMPVRTDQSQVVAAGARANEDGIRNIVMQLAALDATSFGASDGKFFGALADQVFGKLSDKPANPKVTEIATELANASATMTAAKERHVATKSLLLDAVQDVELASKEEVGVAILDLQTRLQASYQTTSILSQLSLVHYL